MFLQVVSHVIFAKYITMVSKAQVCEQQYVLFHSLPIFCFLHSYVLSKITSSILESRVKQSFDSMGSVQLSFYAYRTNIHRQRC